MERQIKSLLKKYADVRGEVNCSEMLEIAKLLNVSEETVGKEATKNGFRVKNCELAQFGNKKTGKFNKKVYEELKKYTDTKNRITCEDALKLSGDFSLYSIRSTIKNSDITVIRCLLGCFREKKRLRLQAKTKVWIENKEIGVVFGKGKAEILELIDKKGSIAAAAKKLGVSYKKIWNHIRTLENNMGKKYVITAKGRGVGGSKITDEAKIFIKKFKKLQADTENYVDIRFSELFYEDRKFRKRSGKK